MSWALLLIVAIRSGLDPFTGVRVILPFLNVPALAGALVILLAAVRLVRDVRAGRRVSHPVLLAWACWLAFLLVAVALGFRTLGEAGAGGVREWVRLLSIGSVFALSFSVFEEEAGGRRALSLLFLALPVPLLAAAGQLVHRSGHWVDGRHRLSGTMAHPNSLGLFLVFFVGLTFWRYRTSKRFPWLALLFLELFVLAKTLYLGGYVMLGILLAVLFIGETGKGRAFIGLLALVFVLSVLAGGDSRGKLEELDSTRPKAVGEVLKGVRRPGSFAWRVGHWSKLISIWAESPVLGHGLQTAVVLNPRGSGDAGFPPHNDYLRYLVETGAVGLLVFLGFLGICASRLFRAFRSARDPGVKALLLALSGVLAAWLVGSLAGNVMHMTSAQFCFWFTLGIAFRLAESDRQAPPGREGGRAELTFVYPLEPGGRKIGGIETFIRGVATSLPATWDVRFAGIVTKESGLRCGTWHEMEVFGRRAGFFPVIRVDDPNRRTRVPLAFRYAFGLLRWRSRMGLEGGILSLHRLEPALALAGLRARRLYFVHGDVRDTFGPGSESRWRNLRRVHQGLERLVIGSMSRVFVVNMAGCEYYRRRYPRLRDRFAFMPAAFDPRVFFVRKDIDREAVLARYGVPAGSRILLFVGRLEEQKAPALLLDAFRLVLQDLPGSVLLIVGQGLLEKSLRHRARELSVADRVLWLGRRDGPEIAELMNASTIFFMTSAFEGMPRVVMEALACGLPVVSTDAGDAKLVVRDGINGRIVTSRDPADIARAAMDVLTSPPRFDPSLPPVSDYTLDNVLRGVFVELEKIRSERT